MPAPAFHLRVALLPLVLLACRTRDNPTVCKDLDECGAGMRCNVSTQRCEPLGGTDVGRTDGPVDGPTAGQTGSDGPVADTNLDAEGSCVTGGNCPSDKPICSSGRCLACLGHADCTADPKRPACMNGSCVPCQDAPAAACGEKSTATPFCAATGACAECVTSRECSQPTAPICTNGKCVRCTSDSQCRERDGDDPGLCLAHLDGRCAKEAEVIYVRSTPPCVNSLTGPGTSDMPFCRANQALEHVTSERRILLLRGMDAFSAIEVRSDLPGIAGGIISIIGQPGAAIVPGADVGVTVGGGDVYLRGLTIRDGLKEGVVADGPATVRLYQTVIALNKGGGLRVSGGAGFEVINTILDGNGPGFLGPIPFGGALLGAPETGRPSEFRYNTVIRNGMVGVACGKPLRAQQLSSVLLTDNGVDSATDNQRNCTAVFSQEGGDPKFDQMRPYWLTDLSPCKDKGDPASSPPDDWKGESRPSGARSDCGADEFHQN